MGLERQKIVFNQSATTGPQRLLLTVLAYHANDETNLCYPQHPTLMQETGMAQSTLKRVIGQLKETGEVLVSNKRGRGRRGNYYIITLGLAKAEVQQMVDDYGKKSITFETFYWESKYKEVSEPGHYNEENVSNYEEKSIETETSTEENVSVLDEKCLNSDTPMLTEVNRNKKELKGELKPLAVHSYRKIAHLYPDKALWQTLDEAIGDKPEDLEFWEKVVTDWIGCGWKKTNLKGMLEHFKRRELPTTGGELSGHKSGSGKSKANGAAAGAGHKTGGIPALETHSRYEYRADLSTGENYWYDSETNKRLEAPPPGMS